MKLNKIITSAIAAALIMPLVGCEDEVMTWGTPEGEYEVTMDEMPLELAEQLANYGYLKSYCPDGMTVGLGLGADLYISNTAYRQVCDDNFQIFTCGNAMKHQSVVGNSGTLTFTTIDNFLDLVPADIDIYGHNFVWHTQQNQTYLKSLIAPTATIVTTGGSDAVCVNVVTNSSFTDGTTGYTGLWGKYNYEIASPGYDDDACIHFEMTDETTANWDSQLFWTLSDPLVEGVTYAYSFYCKSDASITVQFLGQNASYAGIYKDSFTAGSDWTYCTGEFEYDGTNADIIRVGVQFGGTAGSNVWIDDFMFGEKYEAEEDPMINVLPDVDSTFEGIDDDNAISWGSWGSSKESAEVVEGGYNSDYCMKLVSTESSASAWMAQFAYTFDDYLSANDTYMIQFYAKAETTGSLQFQYQNGSTYGSQGGYNTFELGSDWVVCEYSFTPAYEDVNRIILNFGVGGTYYVDNIKFGIKIDTDDENKSLQKKAVSVVYTAKTADEKKEILLGAMESWIQQMSEHLQEKIGDRLVAYDVINEPITDDGHYRGIDNHFGGTYTSDDVTYYDSTPVETSTDGLTLNWGNTTGNGHFYWGYYCGMDYATKAFEYARKYNPNAKLFVNEYNLETSPTKLATLVEFINYIDANGSVKVDGIGTQMHVDTTITKSQVDEMFKTLAATGKLIRVTELDLSLNTSTPSTSDLQVQSDKYQMIVESYLENVPESQRSGITFWTLSDSSDEHEYWLSDCSPNLFDSSYERKHAYKGVCNALAGYDVSEDFSGSDWAN